MLDKVVLVSTRTDLDGGSTALNNIQSLVKEQTANNLPQTCRYRLSQDKLELGGTAGIGSVMRMLWVQMWM
nr:hypothetical protein BaRGS_014214 [Batillaria attramentaria]